MIFSLRKMIVWLLHILSFGLALCSFPTYAGGLTIEGGKGLGVPVKVVSLVSSSKKLEKYIAGKEFIESRVEITYTENVGQQVVIAAIPGLLEQPTVDYVLRSEQECVILASSINGEIVSNYSHVVFKCPKDTLSLVRERSKCLSDGGTWDVSSAYSDGKRCIPENRQSCAERGGTMQRVCMSQELTCITIYSDAHKPCSDGSQCEGEVCIDVGNKVGSDGILMGQCKANNNPCGSFSIIQK